MRLAMLGAALVLAACTSANGDAAEERQDAQRGQGGEGGQRAFEVGAFQSVALEGAQDVVVTVGGAPAVRAEGDAEALERLDIRVEGSTLRIGTRRDGMFSGMRRHGRVTVHVTVPALNAASIDGSGDLRIDRVQAERFEGSIAGSGNMEIGALQARRVEFSIAGSGDIRASGNAEETEVSIAGAGDVRLDGLQVRRASVSIMGSGDVALQAGETVDGSIMGSGDVTVRGTARCSVSKMGSGDVRCGA